MSEVIRTTVSYHETGAELLNKRRPITTQIQHETNYRQQQQQQQQLANSIRASIDSGRDNPFRPGGIIYKAADPIVEYYRVSSNLNSRPQSPTESQKQLDILLGRIKEAEEVYIGDPATTKNANEKKQQQQKQQPAISCWRKLFCCQCFCANKRKRDTCKNEQIAKNPLRKQNESTNYDCDNNKLLHSSPNIDHFNVKSNLRQQQQQQQRNQFDGSVASSNKQISIANNTNNGSNNSNSKRGDSSSNSVASSSAKLSFKPITHITELRFDDSSFSSASLIDQSNKSHSLSQMGRADSFTMANANARISNLLNRQNSNDSHNIEKILKEKLHNNDDENKDEKQQHKQQQQQLHTMVHKNPIINIDSNSSECRVSMSDRDSDRARELLFNQAKVEMKKGKKCQFSDKTKEKKQKNTSCIIS